MSTDFIHGVIYAACGFLTYGLSVAYYQRKYPQFSHRDRVTDRVFSAAMAAFGWFGLIAIGIYVGIFSRYRYGWML